MVSTYVLAVFLAALLCQPAAAACAAGLDDHDSLVARLDAVEQACPAVARRFSLGETAQGRELAALQLSSAPEDADVPAVRLAAGFSGLESAGRTVLVMFAEQLCDWVQADDSRARILASRRLFIMPDMNPDGFAATTVGNSEGQNVLLSFATSLSADVSPSTEGSALQAWHDSEAASSVVLAASLQEGGLVVSYPYDAANASSPSAPSLTADDASLRYFASAYASLHPGMMAGSFTNGITNGALWSPVSGSLADWAYEKYGIFELTAVIDARSCPSAAAIATTIWPDNQPSLLAMLGEAGTAMSGRVVDEQGSPVSASLRISSADLLVQLRSDADGRFFRLLPAGGPYTLQVTPDDGAGLMAKEMGDITITAAATTEVTATLLPSAAPADFTIVIATAASLFVVVVAGMAFTSYRLTRALDTQRAALNGRGAAEAAARLTADEDSDRISSSGSNSGGRRLPSFASASVSASDSRSGKSASRSVHMLAQLAIASKKLVSHQPIRSLCDVQLQSIAIDGGGGGGGGGGGPSAVSSTPRLSPSMAGMGGGGGTVAGLGAVDRPLSPAARASTSAAHMRRHLSIRTGASPAGAPPTPLASSRLSTRRAARASRVLQRLADGPSSGSRQHIAIGVSRAPGGRPMSRRRQRDPLALTASSATIDEDGDGIAALPSRPRTSAGRATAGRKTRRLSSRRGMSMRAAAPSKPETRGRSLVRRMSARVSSLLPGSASVSAVEPPPRSPRRRRDGRRGSFQVSADESKMRRLGLLDGRIRAAIAMRATTPRPSTRRQQRRRGDALESSTGSSDSGGRHSPLASSTSSTGSSSSASSSSSGAALVRVTTGALRPLLMQSLPMQPPPMLPQFVESTTSAVPTPPQRAFVRSQHSGLRRTLSPLDASRPPGHKPPPLRLPPPVAE